MLLNWQHWRTLSHSKFCKMVVLLHVNGNKYIPYEEAFRKQEDGVYSRLWVHLMGDRVVCVWVDEIICKKCGPDIRECCLFWDHMRLPLMYATEGDSLPSNLANILLIISASRLETTIPSICFNLSLWTNHLHYSLLLPSINSYAMTLFLN